MRAMELLFLITSDDDHIYYDIFDHTFTNQPYNIDHVNEQIKKYGKDNLSLKYYKRNIELPNFKEIDHKEIMRYYVKEFIEDKEIRKTLFYILRRFDFVELFIEKLKKLDLYEDFYDVCGNIYDCIIEEWALKNSIDL